MDSTNGRLRTRKNNLITSIFRKKLIMRIKWEAVNLRNWIPKKKSQMEVIQQWWKSLAYMMTGQTQMANQKEHIRLSHARLVLAFNGYTHGNQCFLPMTSLMNGLITRSVWFFAVTVWLTEFYVGECRGLAWSLAIFATSFHTLILLYSSLISINFPVCTSIF